MRASLSWFGRFGCDASSPATSLTTGFTASRPRMRIATMTLFTVRLLDDMLLISPNPGLFLSRSEEHTSELQSQSNLVCRLLLEKKKHRLNQSLKPIQIV